MASLGPGSHKHCEIINQSSVIEDGPPTRYLVKQRIDSQSKLYKKMTFGEKDNNKPHKTILMVGETGSGKTKLINTMINYMLGVQREDKVWFEITDDQSDQTSVHSQTSNVTVYEFYLQESPIHLTIIDTPGYGDNHAKNEKKISSLLKLNKSAETIHEIDAVCLVIKANQTRLSDKKMYIFDAVQSLFGRDIAENIVLLFTHSRGAPPKDTLTAVKEAKVKCAVNDKNQPVYFLFDNCQSEPAYEEGDTILEHSWNLSFKGMAGFFKFLENIKPKTLKMTQDVLQKQEKLEAKISKIQSHVQKTDKKPNELNDTQTDLKQNQKYTEDGVLNDENDTDPSVSRVVTCCPICEVNCYYFLCCRVMKEDYCTVCTNNSQYEEHINEPITEPINKTKTEKRQCKNSKKEKEDCISDGESSVTKELKEKEEEKIKLVIEAFHCVETLQMIALNADSLFILQHIDLLIEKLKEINKPEKAETLENIKKRAGEEKHRALEYMKRCIILENQKSAP